MVVADGLVALTLAFGVLTGYNGSGSLVATLIATRAVGVRESLLLAALGNVVGLALFGTAVALVVGTDIVEPTGITLASIAAALVASVLWTVLTSRLGFPSSLSHALIGGLIGGGIAAGGLSVVRLDGLVIVVLALVVAPIVAAVLGWLALRSTLFLAQGATPRVSETFRRGEVLTSFLLALGYGTNNGQKIVGIIALILYRAGMTPGFVIPGWDVVASGLALSLGISLGGWQVIRTVGAKFFRPRPVHGFVAQATTAAIVLGSTFLGGPVSLSQVASSAIVGVGAGERVSKVHWDVAVRVALAWLLTFPATLVVAVALYPALRWVLG